MPPRTRVMAGLGLAVLLLPTTTAVAAVTERDPEGSAHIPLSVTVAPRDADADREPGPSCALTLTVADGGVELGGGAHRGDRLTFRGTLPTVSVSDRRSAGGGWAVSAQAGELVSASGEMLAPGYLGWVPAVRSGPEGVEPGSPVGSTLRGGPGLRVPATLASAADVARESVTELSAELDLDVPVGTAGGRYTGVLTVTLFPTDDGGDPVAAEDDPCLPDPVEPDPVEPDPEPSPERHAQRGEALR